MDQQEKQLTEKESLELIATMINTAKNSYHDTGIGAIMWGALIAVCSLVKLAEMEFGFRLPFDINLIFILAVIPQIFITIKEKKERRVKSYADSYMDYIWLGFGICIILLTFIVYSMFSVWRPVSEEYRELTGHRSAFQLSEFISPFFLLLYGLPTFITGAACKFRPMFWGGLFCWLCSVTAIYTTIKIDLLLMAASAIMAWLIPGILMEREYRIYKKEQASPDV